MNRLAQRVIFVNFFAPPDISSTSQVLGSLAASLSASYDVHIVSSGQAYSGQSPKPWKTHHASGLQTHRIWTPNFGRRTIAGRILDYVAFHIFATIRVCWLARRNSVIVTMTDPPMIAVPLAIVAGVRGAKLVNWVQDIFPEVAVQLGMHLGGSVAVRLLQRCRDYAAKRAVMNVMLTEKMREWLLQRLPAAHAVTIPNWSPEEKIAPLPRADNPLAVKWEIESQFVVCYSGDLGLAHELDGLIAAAEILRHRPEILILIVGEGSQRVRLAQRVTQLQLTNVQFEPYQELDQQKHVMTLPDVHLLSTKAALEGLVVPTKFYGCMAAGKPVVFIGALSSEFAQWVDRTKPTGILISPDDVAGLASAISYLLDNTAHRMRMATNARSLYLEQFATPVALGNWRTLLDKLCANS